MTIVKMRIVSRERAGFEAGKENIINHYYSDQDTYTLVDAVSVLLSEIILQKKE